MTVRDRLTTHAAQPALFLSDPVGGDTFLVGQLGFLTELATKLDDTELGLVSDFLERFDLETYEGDQPRIFVLTPA